jgi:hypothetical protein
VAERQGVVEVDPPPAVGRHERRVEEAGDVRIGDDPLWPDRVHPDEHNECPDRHRMAQPAHPVADEEHGRRRDPDREPDDRRRDVQPQLGPAIGVLVEREAVCGGDEDDRGQPGERERRGNERPGSLGDDRTSG